ncbi:PREDICTED: uncharacterized protein LOC108378814 [Rhagoletis zephyria]|nr:PREDICTED: uncharacterized protein LOC108378814 [Rhagoletis zephyria]
MYGLKNADTVNEARLELFNEAYKAKDTQDMFRKNICYCDASAEVQQQLLRSSYITSIWLNANLQQPTNKSPKQYGWSLNNKKYEFVWFNGDKSPELVADVLENTEDQEQRIRHGFTSI